MKGRFAVRISELAMCMAIGLCLWLTGMSSAHGNGTASHPEVIDSSEYSISAVDSIILIDNGDNSISIKCGETIINDCSEFNFIEGTDRYVAYADEDYKTFIFDAVTHISHPIEFTSDLISFIKDLPDGPLFSYGGGLFGLDGGEVRIADFGQVDEFRSRNSDYLYITTPIGIGKIEYDKLKFGTQLFMDPKERVNIDHLIETLGTSYNDQSSSIQISLPIIHENPLLRLNILYWISENIYDELTVYYGDFHGEPYNGMKAYLPSIKSTEEEMANYYAYIILQGFREVESDVVDNEEELSSQFWGGGFVARAEPLFENNDYVTLLCCVDSNFGGGTGFGSCLIPIATFDKRSGLRITIRDIVREDCQHDFAKYLLEVLRESCSFPVVDIDDDTLLSMPIGITQNVLQIHISRHTNLAGFLGNDIKIPLSDIEDWLEGNQYLEIEEENNPVFEREVFCRPFIPQPLVEVYSDAFNPDDDYIYPLKEKKYYRIIDSLVYMHEWAKTAPSFNQTATSSINGGINKEIARILMESKDYGRAHETYKTLYEKYGHNNPMGYLSSTYSGLLSSGVRLAGKLIDDNDTVPATNIVDNIRRWYKGDGYYGDDITEDYLIPKADIDILESRIHALSGRNDSAAIHAKMAFPILQNHLNKTLLNITNKDRGEVWNHYSKWCLNFLPALATLTRDSLLKTYSYESVLSGKGLMLNTDIAVRKSILYGTDETAKRLLLDNDSLSAEIMKMHSHSKKVGSERDNENNIEKLKEQIERNNIELSRRSNYYGRNIERQEISLADVADALDEDETAIEFIAMECKELNIPPSYYAMVVRPNSHYPEMIFLGERSVIDNLASAENAYESTEIYDKIWVPIMPLLKNSGSIYFSPDGILYTTAIEHLPYNASGESIGELLKIKRLSSTRLIPMLKQDKESSPDGIHGIGVLYGGIDYDEVTYGPTSDLEENSFDNEYGSKANGTPNTEFRTAFSNLMDRAKVIPLIGTLEEVENIRPYALNMKGLDDVVIITGSEASEESFKNLPQSNPTMLHIATHGFYFTEEELADLQSDGLLNATTSAERDFNDTELLRSGLIMAGANMSIQHNSVSPENDDGILTAKEISLINLLDIDLATLSACQTGLGEIDSDGVAGLQRGFKKAGVNSILMSLWKVDDEATQILMTEFYRQLALTGEKSTSLRAAQRYLRSYENGIYAHPYYWAPFILLDAL